jgi:DEAD/DEAH box helicase domain-containing protein
MDEKTENDLFDGLPNEAYVPTIIQNPIIASLKYDTWDSRNSMATLIRWLGTATGEKSDPHVIKQAKHAYYLSAKVIPHPQDPSQQERRTVLQSFWAQLTDLPCPVPVNYTTSAGNVDTTAFKLRYHWPKDLIDNDGQLKPSPGFLVLERSAVIEEKEYHLAWRRWLRMFNLFQTLPGVYLATADGLEAGDYQSIRSLVRSNIPSGTQTNNLDLRWDNVSKMALSNLRTDIPTLRELNVSAPDEIGYELEESGKVVAEAEMVWLTKKVALVLSDSESSEAFNKQGWRTVEIGQEWPKKIAELLLVKNDQTINGQYKSWDEVFKCQQKLLSD